MKYDDELIEKAYIASWSEWQAEQNRIEMAEKERKRKGNG